MYIYTLDGDTITSYGLVDDNMSKSEMKVAQKSGFYFTDKEIIDDHQGNFYFKDELDENKLAEINSFLLDIAKDMKIGEFKRLREEKEGASIEVNGSIFDADTTSIDRIRTAILLDKEIEWTLADNSIITVNAESLTNVLKAIANRNEEIYNKFLEIKTQVNACTSEEEVNLTEWVD